jgi:TolB protein
VIAPGGGVATATFPGTPGAIVFASDRGFDQRNIWIGVAGDMPKRLVSSRSAQWGPVWSPDGRRIAYYVSHVDEGAGIVTAGADGTGRRALTRTSTVAVSPAWSPDGSRIVFVQAATGQVDLFVMDANGTRQRRLTSTGPVEADPSWSPDGTQILFVSRCESSGSKCIYVGRSDGRGASRVVASGQAPDWSPDGASIAYVRGTAIYVADAGGGNEHMVVTDPAGVDDPAWSPDGSTILFARGARDDCGTKSVQRFDLVDVDGSDQRRLFPSTCANDYTPDWQPRCTIYGTDRADVLVGTEGDDIICAARGNDRIAALGGNDVVIAGDGDDVVYGGPGRDRLFGSAGADKIFAADGEQDVVNGGPGLDRVASRDDGVDRLWEVEMVQMRADR